MTFTLFATAIFASIWAADRLTQVLVLGRRLMELRVLILNKTTINRSGLNISSER